MPQLPSHRWNFDEDVSTASDQYGQVNATLHNATRLSPGYSSAKAVRIGGSDDSFISFGSDVGQFRTRDFTVSFWINTSETTRFFDLIGNRTASSPGNFLSVRMPGAAPPGRGTAEVDEDGNGRNYIAVEGTITGANDGRW